MYSFVIDNKFLKGDITCKIHFYVVFAYKYVSAVCEHNHPTIIKIHSLFFLIPQKPKQSQLSSRFDSEAPPTAADRLSCISIFPPSAMSRRQCRCFIVACKSEHKSLNFLPKYKPPRTFVFDGNVPLNTQKSERGRRAVAH